MSDENPYPRQTIAWGADADAEPVSFDTPAPGVVQWAELYDETPGHERRSLWSGPVQPNPNGDGLSFTVGPFEDDLAATVVEFTYRTWVPENTRTVQFVLRDDVTGEDIWTGMPVTMKPGDTFYGPVFTLDTDGKLVQK